MLSRLVSSGKPKDWMGRRTGDPRGEQNPVCFPATCHSQSPEERAWGRRGAVSAPVPVPRLSPLVMPALGVGGESGCMFANAKPAIPGSRAVAGGRGAGEVQRREEKQGQI